MFPDEAELAGHGLAISDAVIIRARGEESCAFCGIPSLDVRVSDEIKRQWLVKYHKPLAAAILREDESAGQTWYGPEGESGRGALAQGEDHPWYGNEDTLASRLREQVRRAIWDSRLEATVGIPEEVLTRVLPRMSEELRSFVEDQFVFAICGRCKYATITESDVSAPKMLERYVNFYFDGNRAAAEFQPAWSLAQELMSIVALELKRLRAV